MQLEVGAEVLEVVVVGQLVRNVLLQGHINLVSPAAGIIPEEEDRMNLLNTSTKCISFT